MTEQERVAKCPSTHCERRGECASPNDCIVRTAAKAAWDRGDGYAYTALRAELSRIERTAFSSIRV